MKFSFFLKRMSNVFSNKKVPIFLSLILAVLPFIFYLLSQKMILQSNIFLMLNPAQLVNETMAGWSDSNFGKAKGATFADIMQAVWFLVAQHALWFKPELSQTIISIIFFLTGGVGFVYFIKNHLNNSLNNSSIIMGLFFFLFNGYTLTYMYGTPNFIYVYLLLPWQLFLFEKYIKQGKKDKTLLPLIFLILINQIALWVNLVFVFITFVAQLILGLFYIFKSRLTLFRFVKMVVIVWGVTIPLMSWWLIPQIYGGLADPISSANVLSSEDFYNSDSGPSKVFGNFGYWAFFGGYKGELYNNNSVLFQSNLGIFVTFVPLLVVVSGLIFKRINFRFHNKYYLWVVTMLSVYPIVGGINSKWPTAGLMQWLFDSVPYFSIFRNTHKWLMLVVFAQSVLLVLFSEMIFRKLKGMIGYLICLCLGFSLFIGAWPFFSSQMIKPQSVINEIPIDWIEMAKKIESSKKTVQRVGLLPDQYSEMYIWEGKRVQIPGSLSDALFQVPIVSNTCRGCLSAYTDSLIRFLYKKIGKLNYDVFLGQLGISHILQRDDYAHEYYGVESPEDVVSLLSLYSSIRLNTTIGNLSLYDINSNLVNPIIYSPSSLTVANTLESYFDLLDEKTKRQNVFILTDKYLGTINQNLQSVISEYGNYKKTLFSSMDNIELRNNFIFEKNNLPISGEYLVVAKSDNRLLNHINLNDKEFLVKTGGVNVNLKNAEYVVSNALVDYPDNLFPRGSFESKDFGSIPNNCRDQSRDAVLGLEYVKDATDGLYSIELFGDKDSACISSRLITDDISSGFYTIKFDYKIIEGEEAQVCIFDGKSCIFDKKYYNISTEWTHAEEVFKVSENENNLTLYLYSPAQKGFGRVRYDNFIINKIKNDIFGMYEISTKSTSTLEVIEPQIEKISSIHYRLHFPKFPKANSLLVFQETFHPDWQLQCSNSKYIIDDRFHFIANGFGNGWILNHDSLKDVKENEDGTFTLELRFTLNRWFYLGLLISGTTLLGCVGYLGYEGVKSVRRRQKNRKEYEQHEKN